MATVKERMLALAVARGLLEPREADGGSLEELVASGRLSPEDRQLLEQDLADLDAAERNHWSVDISASMVAEAYRDSPSAVPAASVTDEAGSAQLPYSTTGFGAGGVLRAQTLDRWGRFQALELLGEGGMGRIFQATDPRLSRKVALKILRREDPKLLQRFIQEAQLQARVDHPNVCRVYEVGEWRGQPYIAMQYIRGETLLQAATTLPLETLLRLMVEVCEGVHAAHRVGLVHRDLKPANLMVDHLEDGSTRACVLDFGLARGLEGGSMTETGRVMGTVSYMSPEQARGHSTLLDRRSDVFSLGSTLYALLTGAPPFEGDGLECMGRIVKEDPVPLRQKVPGLPMDLETVVSTCLEKDPRRRYATARALGEDLQRVLDNETIQARPPSLLERLGRWAWKRKALVSASAAILLTIAIAGGYALRVRFRAQTQAAFAQRFSQAAERIEALARYLRLQPARDLTGDLVGLRARVEALAQDVRASGPLAEAPGAYALGRARLALEDPVEARIQLEKAWSRGYHAPEAAHALGRSLAAIYEVELGKAAALPDADLRQRRIEELRHTLRMPAADWLRRGASASLEPPAFRAGLLMLMEGHPAEAVLLARDCQAQAPWFYEALRLEAEAWLAQARLAPGEPAAKPALEAAGRALAEAELRAPCDVDLLKLDMRRWQEAVAQGWQTGADPRVPVLAQVAVAGRWARLEPQSAQPLAWRARARGEVARYLTWRDMDPAPWLDQAKADAQEALRRDPDDLETCVAQASVLRTEGFRQLNRSEDPSQHLMEAVAAANRGLARDPMHIVLMSIRNSALHNWIESARMRGTYQRSLVEPNLKDARALATSHPDEAYFQSNLGTLALASARAELDHGGNPGPDAEEAIRAYEAALKPQPHHVGNFRGILMAQSTRAKYLAREGRDPRPVVDSAQLTFQRAKEIGLPLGTLAPYLMDTLLTAATWTRIHGQESGYYLEEASRLRRHLDPVPDSPLIIGTIRLRYHTLMLQIGQQSHEEAGQALAKSLIRLNPLDPSFWMTLAQFHEASENPAAAARARARGRAINPRWRSD